MPTIYTYSFGPHDDVQHYRTPHSVFKSTKMLFEAKSAVRDALTAVGWEGDGDYGVVWLPPFVFQDGGADGAVVWHVKQKNNGTSFLASSRPLCDLPGLSALANVESAIEVSEQPADGF